MSVRTIVIGDLHGEYDALDRLLRKVSLTREDKLVFIGDYCDHFSSRKKCNVNRLIEDLLKLQSEYDTTFLLGNHDSWFLRWVEGTLIPVEFRSWFSQGGKETLMSYGLKETETLEKMLYTLGMPIRGFVSKEHIKFLKQLKQYHQDDIVTCIHGGFTSEKQIATVNAGDPLHFDAMEACLWDRSFIFMNRDMLESECGIAANPFSTEYLVTGHTPSGPSQNPWNDNWWMIDSTTHLCALVIDNETLEHKLVDVKKR